MCTDTLVEQLFDVYSLLNCVFLSAQMRFSLYLHGDFNGTLLVSIEENGTTTAPPVWERNHQGTDDWEDVALQLTGLRHGCVKGRTEGQESQMMM